MTFQSENLVITIQPANNAILWHISASQSAHEALASHCYYYYYYYYYSLYSRSLTFANFVEDFWKFLSIVYRSSTSHSLTAIDHCRSSWVALTRRSSHQTYWLQCLASMPLIIPGFASSCALGEIVHGWDFCRHPMMRTVQKLQVGRFLLTQQLPLTVQHLSDPLSFCACVALFLALVFVFSWPHKFFAFSCQHELIRDTASTRHSGGACRLGSRIGFTPKKLDRLFDLTACRQAVNWR